MTKNNSICLSHKEDPDGIVSASMIKQRFDSKIFLTDYTNLKNTLNSILKENNFQEIYICDLAIKLSNIEDFITFFSVLSTRKIKIWFIDHHFRSNEIQNRLKNFKITYLSSDTDCTAAIIYKNFSNHLKDNVQLISACACITDGLENTPLASNLMNNYNKNFIQLNSALLWYEIRNNQNNMKKLVEIIELLANGKIPIEFIKSIENFKKILINEFSFDIKIKNQKYSFKNFDCLKITDSKLSQHASELIRKSQKSICVVHRDFDSKKVQQVVILSSKNNTKNLGILINKLSKELQGFGGGDQFRSATIIPTNNFDKFLEFFDNELSKLD